MSLPPGFLDELRGRVSLAKLAGKKVTWDSRKSNAAKGDYWAPCPFHQEKTPSFHVDDVKGYYYCFGCHAKGDAISFLQETENLDFMAAVEAMAREAGLPMPARDPAAAARAESDRGLVEAMEAAVRFYRLQLSSGRAAGAREYLDARGMAPAIRERFEIGYAPEARSALLEHLLAKGFSRERLAEAGLIGLPETGAAYDRFRGRIMFPIRDSRGRAIAFGARAIAAGQEPKYLNSPETPLFSKGRTLFNIAGARAAAARTGALIVAEGYMDVIALAQAGIDHAVAPLGTAITEAQLQLLWRIAPEPVVALDGDKAGQAAGQRMIDIALPLLGEGRSLRFALLPPGQDPDDVVRSGGARAIETLLAASRPIVDLIWSRETQGRPLDSPERRNGLDARLRAHLARIADPGLRAHYKAEIQARRSLLFAPASGRRGSNPRPRAVEGSALLATRASLLAQQSNGPLGEARVRESAILLGCLHHPEIAREFEDRLERVTFLCPDLEQMRAALLSALSAILGNDATPLSELLPSVSERVGRDPLPELMAIGQVRVNRHLSAEALPHQVRQAVEEELIRHSARVGKFAEVAEAEQELRGAADEGVTWRLRHAVEAAEAADILGFDPRFAESFLESEVTSEAQRLLDNESWKKPRKH